MPAGVLPRVKNGGDFYGVRNLFLELTTLIAAVIDSYIAQADGIFLFLFITRCAGADSLERNLDTQVFVEFVILRGASSRCRLL